MKETSSASKSRHWTHIVFGILVIALLSSTQMGGCGGGGGSSGGSADTTSSGGTSTDTGTGTGGGGGSGGGGTGGGSSGSNSNMAIWHLNENSGTSVSDASGNGNTGTVKNAVWTTDVPSSGGGTSALSFDGNGDYVEFPNSSTLNPTSGITVEAWIKPTSFPSTGGSTIVNKNANPQGYILRLEPGVINWILSIGNTYQVVSASSSGLTLNYWNHVAGTYDGNQMKIWVNNSLATSKSVSGTITPGNNNLRIGGSNNPLVAEWFSGKIDEVIIRNYAETSFGSGTGGGGGGGSSITYQQYSTNANGAADMLVAGKNITVVTKDVETGSVIPNITVYAVTDDTDVAFFVVDTTMRYAPRIVGVAVSQLKPKSPDESDERQITGIIKEIRLAQINRADGRQPRSIDNVKSRLLRFILDNLFVYWRTTTLENLAPTLKQFATDYVLDKIVEFAVESLLTLGTGIIIEVIEIADTAALEAFEASYRLKGYAPTQEFDIYRCKIAYLPWVLPREAPATTPTVSGNITVNVSDARTGQALTGAVISCFPGGNTGTGSANFTNLIQGEYTIMASQPGYNQGFKRVTIDSTTSNHNLTISLNPLLPAGDLRIVLTWGTTPSDLDAHLWTPMIYGTSYEVYFGNEYPDTSVPPYASLDVDDLSAFGPETITIAQRFPGTYRYSINNFSEETILTQSQAVVEVYDSAGLIKRYTVPTSGTGTWWNVFTIDGITGGITDINTISTTDPNGNPKPYLFKAK